jgi:nucleotide-binding universal stress UspA family protein
VSSGVVLAHDLSPQSGPVTAAAADLSVRLGLPLTVLHVVKSEDLERDRLSRPAESAYTDHVLDDLRVRLTTSVERELASQPVGRFLATVIAGDPESAIIEYADAHGAEFLVIGVRSRSRVGKLLFGSVPQAVLLQSPTKVVTVPIEGPSR